MKGGSAMTCHDIREHLSAYLDQALDKAISDQINAHLDTCSTCQQELADLRFTIQLVRELPEVEAPTQFHQSLRERLAKEISNSKYEDSQAQVWESKGSKSKLKYWLSSVAVAAVLLIAVAVGQLSNNVNFTSFNMGAIQPQSGASREITLDMGVATTSGKDNMIAYGDSAPGAKEAAPFVLSPEADAASKMLQIESEDGLHIQQRIIKDAYIRLEVSSFQHTASAVETIVVGVGGYIQDSTVTAIKDGKLTAGDLTLRVPQERFESTISELEQLGKLRTKGLNGHNVTMEYIDIEGRLRVVREKEQRLLSLLEKADRLEDVLNIERELSYARSEIEHMVGRIRYLNHATNLATIRISLTEVETSTDRITAPGITGILQDAAAAFIVTTNKLLRLLGDLVVYGGASLPIIAIILIGLLIGVKLKNYYKKK